MTEMNLPTHWSKPLLQEICGIIAGQSPESQYYNENGEGLPFFQGKTDFGALYPSLRVYCTKPKKIAEQNDILLSVRAPVGPTNLSPGTVCIGRGLTAIRPKSMTNYKYILYFFKSIEKKLMASGTGTTFKAITQDDIKKIKVPLPSITEQERIVAKIEELFSELDKGVEVLQKTKAQLKVYRQAVLKDAFEGKFTELWRKNHECQIDVELNAASKELIKNLPQLPSSWIYVSLDQLGDLGRGKSRHRPRNDKKLFESGKYPFIQTGEVKAAKRFITTSGIYYGEFGLHQSKLWPVGTLCITIAANIAETAFLGIDACFPDSIVGFKNYESVSNSDYIEYFIQSARIKLWAFAPATAQKNINLTTLENLIVPYCSLKEQKAVVNEIESRLSICDKIEQTVDESLLKSEGLRQSILKKAFEGKLVTYEEAANG
jgi:type I restriction enzyme S subunit